MVKNTKGGKKGKKGGRKHGGSAPTQRGVRTVQEDGECYAAVVKLYGGNCEVMCDDGVTSLCVIRNKFRGRGRRDNMLTPGKWVMVGIRDWEARAAGKPQKCDLLEVYSDSIKNALPRISLEIGIFCSAVAESSDPGASKDDIGDIEFGDFEDNDEMDVEIQEQAKATGKNTVIDDLGETYRH